VPIRDPNQVERIKKLAIPPAWTDVWICPDPSGHLQATGRDARGRKQYRYHVRWREVRDETKYWRMIAFGGVLPVIRDHASRDLSKPCLNRDKVLATIVALLDTTAIRVGNEEYARDNSSFGLTTLRTRHVQVSGSEVKLRFSSKGGKEYQVVLHDARLARAVKRCRDLPGHELFKYIDEAGEMRSIDSADVNEYLQQITGQHFTAKDFRTWHGTLHAACSLHEVASFKSQVEAKRNINRAIEKAAEHLGNTVAICRKAYVHPAVIEAYVDGWLAPVWDQVIQETKKNPTHGLHAEEVAVLVVLQRAMDLQANEDKAS
jgi:DNA topoisomerase I